MIKQNPEIILESSNYSWNVPYVQWYERAKNRYMQKTQFVEPTGRKDNIFYESFSTTVDDTVKEIVALASTLGLTSVADIPEYDEYFYGDESTNWSE